MATPELTSEDLQTDFDSLNLPQNTYKDQIETVIYSLEENDSAMVQATEDGYIWKFQYGTIEVFVQLTGETDEDLFTVWAKVLSLPAKNELQLFRKLMELNWSGTFETCFSLFNDQIVVSTQRTVDDLSPAEISRAITLVATIADEYDEPLQAEYL
ncbi:YbjN domain-containing protein [Geminocystis sp. GBBB08]|uniref:YbjN domain-containing protein n=1 Tax=Geminocystis sp. GBBB08 TaxID=2604140 RepID=UPI0027E2A218|nr:YbjN domain-containing protein [Geminocystis sp. GBBB08]MBL1208592.1 YbjN domain-containing protein [Geminocystis sp. GBBB08]